MIAAVIAGIGIALFGYSEPASRAGKAVVPLD
jgi:hypothetical protein